MFTFNSGCSYMGYNSSRGDIMIKRNLLISFLVLITSTLIAANVKPKVEKSLGIIKTITTNDTLVDANNVPYLTGGVVSSNDISYLSILRSMTNFVSVDSSSNWLAYNPTTRLLSGCVTNVGTTWATISNIVVDSMTGTVSSGV